MDRPRPASRLHWLAALAIGAVVPALAVLRLGSAPHLLAPVGGPLLAVGLMGMAMVVAATTGRASVGMALALATGIGLIQLARALGMPPLPHPLSTTLALGLASLSFAARGRLFARAYPRRGWVLSLAIVAGEGAMLLTAGSLPGWLLAALPAQWTSTAVQTALTGSGTRAAAAALLALAGTGVTTLLVAALLPRRWPYALMFTGWLVLSALVWHRPAPSVPHADLIAALQTAGRPPAD